MNKKVIVLLSAFVTLASCNSNIIDDDIKNAKLLRSPENESHEFSYDDTLSEGFINFKNKMNDFAADISETLINDKYDASENFCMSPLSIEMCLSLATYCANNNTQKELENALGVTKADLNNYFKLYFNTNNQKFYNETNQLIHELSLYNSIFFDNDINLLEKGLDDLQKDYYCYSYEVDFATNADKAINEFIKKTTNNLIDPKLEFDPETVFVLMNTLYLKDLWRNDGEDLSYADSSYKFTNANGTISNKKLLAGLSKPGKAIENENYTAFFTYLYGGTGLYFIKPEEGHSVSDVLTKENIKYVINPDNYIKQDDELLEKYRTRCIFPEFKAECNESLKKTLQDKYGVNDLFTDKCDLSNIIDDDAYCSDVSHIAKLDVNKSGIEGAAVTYMEVPTSAYDPYTTYYYDFVVDKECAFILTNNYNIVFSGTLNNID